ncbi:MAG: hypothetical protein ACETWM_02035 [Candidatus Lokiarchaeia archaeon]
MHSENEAIYHNLFFIRDRDLYREGEGKRVGKDSKSNKFLSGFRKEKMKLKNLMKIKGLNLYKWESEEKLKIEHI